MTNSDKTPVASADDTKLTVYFDGACPLCSAEIAHYKRQSGADAICFVDASAPDQDFGPDLSQNDALARIHVRKSDGSLSSGAAAFASVWEVLPKWRWAAKIAGLPGMGLVLEGLYRAFLPIRPYLSKAFGRLTG